VFAFLKKLTQKYPRLYEFFKYGLNGVLATLVDFLVMAIVIYLFQPHKFGNFFHVFYNSSEGKGKEVASTASVIVGSAMGFLVSLYFNYLISVYLVFNKCDTKTAKTFRGFLIFSIVAGGGLLIHIFGMYVGYDIMKINEWIMKIGLSMVVLVYSYILRKLLIFKKTLVPSSNIKENIETGNDKK